MDTSKSILFLFMLFLPSLSGFSSRFPTSALSSETRNSDRVVYKIGHFTQTLDHFNYNPGAYQTFQQRYLVDDRHWAGAAESAPIFVYTGNEGDIEWFARNTGFMFDVAPRFKALLVFIEHRYYGESIPFGGEHVAFANATTLGYLSTGQALADFATLITDLKKKLRSQQSPVVVFGGSYGGMLAAWFRLKYPHVAVGALASSAPILGFLDLDLVSPYAFDNVITNDYKSESENCYKVIKNFWNEFEEVSKQYGGTEKLGNSFKICKEQWGNSLASDIEGWISYALIYGAMTDYPTPSDFLNPLPAYPVKKMCEAIDNPSTGTDTLAKLYGAMNVYFNNSGTAKCFDLNSYFPRDLGGNGWSWQACTEMILVVGGSNNDSMFPASTFNSTQDAESCQKYYGVASRPNWITTEFGGQDIQRVLKRFGSNIIFFNGLRDPWSSGGVLKSLSSSIIAIVATEGAHHVDLRFSTEEDPEWLQEIRRREVNIIEGWLQQYYNDS